MPAQAAIMAFGPALVWLYSGYNTRGVQQKPWQP